MSDPYQVVIDYLKRELARGRWTPGELMPSESELVQRFGFSRMTVNRAVKELQTAGLVKRVRGAGTYAAQLHRLSSTLTIRDLHDETAVILAGHEPLMGYLAAYLLNAPSLQVDMKKSAMVRIDLATLGAAPRGVLRWMIVPKLAR